MRKLLHRTRPEIRPRRYPITQAQVDEAKLRSFLEANLPKVNL